MSDILQVKELCRSFAQQKVLNGISFEVHKGELLALLGRNGAGKTTCINLCLGLDKMDSGQIKILGHAPGSMQARLQTGITPQGTDFPEGLKVIEVLSLIAAHYQDAMPVSQAIKQFHLTDIAARRTHHLSYGQQRALAVALAFIGRPKLVFLDEPTTGLDINTRQALWESIREFVATGGTLILTTHYLEEAEQLASRLLVLEDGCITRQGTVAEVLSESGSPSVSFNASYCPSNLQYAKSITISDGFYEMMSDDTDALIRELVAKGIDFKNLTIKKNNLEKVFLDLNNKKEAV